MDSSPPRTPKRKRSPSVASSIPSHLPLDTINPFSLTPSTLLQFRTAGLKDTDADPAKDVPNFPHRGLRTGSSVGRAGDEEDAAGEDEERGGDKEKQKKEPALQERQFHVLIQSIHHLLDRGDIGRAARAYAIALQLRPTGAAVDVRHYNLWAIGAEILMREGEVPLAELSPDQASIQRQRWGSAKNMPKVRAYFETLIQQYPVDERNTNKLSGRDFWAALLSCEVYNAHAEHVLGLRRLEEGNQEERMQQEDETEDLEDEYDMGEDTFEKRREAKQTAAKEKLRQRALAVMEDVSGRMGGIIEQNPYRRDITLLKLQATMSLYMADLVIPLVPISSLATQRAQDRRQGAQDQARAALEGVLELGGQLDPAAVAFLGLEDEEEALMAPIYSSLPIR